MPDEISLDEVTKSEILDLSEQGIILAKASSPEHMDPKDYRVEVGSTGLRLFSGYVNQEFLVELQGLRGYRIFEEMRRNDPIIGGLLFATEQAIRRVRWYPDSPDNVVTKQGYDKSVEFLGQCKEDMSHSWNDFISEALTFLPFGWSWFEVVYKERDGVKQKDPSDIIFPNAPTFDSYGAYTQPYQPYTPDAGLAPDDSGPPSSKFDDGMIGWRKFAYRPPDTLFRWEVDQHGGIRGMWQQDIRRAIAPVFIPIEKSILFRTKRERNNPEGISVLRNSYRAYYFKRELEKFEAIALERTGAGIPVIQLPVGYTKTDLDMAKKVVRRLRVDEQMGVTLPPNWTLTLLRPNGRAETQTYEEAITRYSNHMLMSLLLTFIALGTRNVGSNALVKAQQDFFRMALVGWVQNMADTINQYAVAPLFQMNSGSFPKNIVSNPPVFRTTDIGEYDLDTISSFVMRAAQVGFLTPDDAAENWLRKIVGMPGLDDAVEPKVQDADGRDALRAAAFGASQVTPDVQTEAQGGKTMAANNAKVVGQKPPAPKPKVKQNPRALAKAVENDYRLRQRYREIILKGAAQTTSEDLRDIRGMIEEVVSELMETKERTRYEYDDDGD